MDGRGGLDRRIDGLTDGFDGLTDRTGMRRKDVYRGKGREGRNVVYTGREGKGRKGEQRLQRGGDARSVQHSQEAHKISRCHASE